MIKRVRLQLIEAEVDQIWRELTMQIETLKMDGRLPKDLLDADRRDFVIRDLKIIRQHVTNTAAGGRTSEPPSEINCAVPANSYPVLDRIFDCLTPGGKVRITTLLELRRGAAISESRMMVESIIAIARDAVARLVPNALRNRIRRTRPE
jgi:hypothetical protein